MTDTPRLDTWLATQRLQDTFDGYSASEIEAMPMADYARIRERAGLDPIDPYTDAYAAYEPPGQDPAPAPQNAPGAPQSAPEGITDAEFHAWRAGRVSGGEGVGIMNQQGGTDAWVAAARTKVGRTKYGQQNTQDAAKPDASKYLNNGGQQVAGRTGYYR